MDKELCGVLQCHQLKRICSGGPMLENNRARPGWSEFVLLHRIPWKAFGILVLTIVGVLLTSELRDSGTKLRTCKSPTRQDGTGSDSGRLEDIDQDMDQDSQRCFGLPHYCRGEAVLGNRLS